MTLKLYLNIMEAEERLTALKTRNKRSTNCKTLLEFCSNNSSTLRKCVQSVKWRDLWTKGQWDDHQTWSPASPVFPPSSSNEEAGSQGAGAAALCEWYQPTSCDAPAVAHQQHHSGKWWKTEPKQTDGGEKKSGYSDDVSTASLEDEGWLSKTRAGGVSG